MSINELSVDTVFQKFETEKEDYIWIDVRQPEEWAEGTIPGVQKIMLSELPAQLNDMDKNAAYMMICRSGGRSGNASQKMNELGFTNVTNFVGGMLAWNEKRHPTE